MAVNLDGPTLRAIREHLGVPLRRIAKQARMSHGHLSKVERGEHGRPVTAAIMTAYEKVTGVQLSEAAVMAEQTKANWRQGRRTWTPGKITDIRRQGFNAAIAALTLGGPLGDAYTRVLDSTGRPTVPDCPVITDVEQLEQVAALLTGLDLRFGGGLMSHLAKYVLRWAVGMLDADDLAVQLSRRLAAAAAQIAARAAWAAFDVNAHEPARALFRLALFAAVRAEDVDLSGHILADVAAQHNHLAYHEDALRIIRMVEGDERIGSATRMVVHGVKARAYAALGDAEDCRRHVTLAEHAHDQASRDAPGWQVATCTPAHLAATTGHALAVLAVKTLRESDQREAEERLTAAVHWHDPTTHARAVALCTARLALLQLSGPLPDADQAARWARSALDAAAHIQSARLVQALLDVSAAVHATADAGSTWREVLAGVDRLISGDQ